MGVVEESGGVVPGGPLLTMKLVPPVPAPGSLPRPQVVERLAGPEAPISLISAPAGWGKTSLLAEWIDAEQGRRPVAFLRLEEGDLAAAIEDLEAIGNDPQAPQDVQQRADQILTIIAPGKTQNG